MTSDPKGDFVYVNDEVVKSFASEGSAKLITGLETNDPIVATSIFSELLLAYNAGKVEFADLVTFLEQSLTKDERAIEVCQIIDVFAASEKIKQLVAELFLKDVISPSIIAANIKPETLLAIVPENFNKLLSTRRRDQFYTQKKYNLLHEESEGFGKLVVEMYHVLRDGETPCKLNYSLKVIESLIGHYNLDPNRALDVLLEVFSNNFVSNYQFVIDLLKRSQWWPLVHSDSTTSFENLAIGGSETAAKLIGLRLMRSSKDSELSDSFRVFVGCLIKEGFISFGALFPFIDSGDMNQLENLYKKDLESRVLRASANALSLAAPLVDEEEEASENSLERPTTKLEEPSLDRALSSNHVYQFLRAFLELGLYYPSVCILAKYPFLAYVDDNIPILINRLFVHMMTPLTDNMRNVSRTDSELLQKPNPEVDAEAHSEYYSFRPFHASHSSRRYSYFYPNWADGLPVILTTEEFFNMAHELLQFVGVNLSKSPGLFSSICDLAVSNYPNHKEKWFNFFRNFIYPAMCVVEENPFLIEKGFAVMKCFSLEERYNLYGELHQVLSKSNPHIQISYGRAEKATKDILKRLSKENVKPMMRRLAKTSFANPLPCLLTILQQVESYDNLISLVVDTAKYFNQYGWEALTLAIMMRISVTGRSSIQQNGLNERQWIQSLAQFVGKICQRYPHLVDLKTLMSFIIKSLHQKDMISVIVLKEMLRTMGGIQSINNLTLTQIDMMNSEPSLRKLAYRTVNDTRYECQILGQELIKVIHELGAANEIFIQLCQLSQEVIHSTEQSHLKILANKNDEMNSVLQLFVQFFNFFGYKESMSKDLLSVKVLCDTYHVEPRWAYRMWNGLEALDDQRATVPESISGELYDTFWKLNLFDINYSVDLYDDETAKLEGAIPGLKEQVSAAKKDKDTPLLTINNYKQTLEQNLEFIKILPKDSSLHAAHNKETNIWLSEHKEKYFLKQDTVEQFRSFLQYCLLPRAITSSFDAAFSGKLLFKFHDLEVENYSLISLLDELFGNQLLFGTLFTLSPLEAENLGIFYAEILNSLHEWTDPILFTQNCLTLLADDKKINHEDYRTKLFEYHEMLLADISNSLTVKEYMCRRNAITFLKNLLGVYPNVEDHCETMLRLIQNISDHEERQDLKLSSYALTGHVRSRSKEWVHKWDFVPMGDEEKEALIKKHNDAKEKEKAEKLKQEEQAKQEKLKSKIAKESEEREKKQAAALSYDDSSRPASRTDIRKLEPKSRYDYYNKYGGSKDKDAPRVASERAPPGAGESKGRDKKLPQAETTSGQKAPTHSKESRIDAKPESNEPRNESKEPRKEARPAALNVKERIQQATSRLKAALNPPSGPGTPEPDLFPSVGSRNAEAPSSRRNRTALPPQEYVARAPSGPSGPSGDRRKRFDRQDRPKHAPVRPGDSARQVIPPPPPPPPAPQRLGERLGDKRKRDTYEGRGYEKRQKR